MIGAALDISNWLVIVLNRERVRRRVYRSRDEARQDVFDYIEMFYNPKRKYVRNGMLSPVEFEQQQNPRVATKPWLFNEKRRSHPAFKSPNSLTDRGGRDPQLSDSATEMAMLGNAQECLAASTTACRTVKFCFITREHYRE
jgi:hypothetical protein